MDKIYTIGTGRLYLSGHYATRDAAMRAAKKESLHDEQDINVYYGDTPDGAVMIAAYRRGALVYNKKNKATQAHERVFLKGALYGNN